MAAAGQDLLERVVASMASAGDLGGAGSDERSILSQAAAAFARRPQGAEQTIPTGFDPLAASLFEAVVEASFLVATADGVLDGIERDTFEAVVHQACQNGVQRSEIHHLVSELVDQLEEDGLDRRIQAVASVVRREEHKDEVMRIAALMAHVSGGVHESERAVLDELATKFGLPEASVDAAIARAAAALAAG